ncbi:Monocarboxylate transporter 14 [Acanthosepion pharaonis]|uniref:Monocarboxylate transporter 14 n=1 Tax=Acanthosepion pharaonis TaxID=158019 RepID=A0A812CRN7_ACAPH|nr:Monocarboxylate transporter 14 [Sepia pharaonis]
MSDSDEPRNCNTEPLRGSFCESTDSEDSIYPQSPDGGWGWVVLISSFLLNLIADGCAYSFGVFFTELLETFGETKSKTSWVGSLFVGVSLICGPLAGALTTKFGCRKMTIAGGILSMTGIVASAFVNSIEMLCFTFGFVAGFGMSIPYVTSIVSVSFYFEKKRALATGLSVCGSGIGTSVFAPLLEYLIDIYGWRGTMLILGGIVGNVVVCGCLLRPLEYSPKEKYEKALETFTKISKNDARLNSKFDEGLSSRSYDAQLTYCSNIANLVVSNSVVHLPTYLQLKRVSISNEVFHKLWGNSCHNSEVRVVLGEPNVKQTTSYPDSFSSNRIVAPPFCTSDNLPEKGMKDVWQQKSSTKRKPSAASQQTILYRKDIFYRGNLLKLSLDQKSCSCPEISHLVGTADDPDSAEDFLECANNSLCTILLVDYLGLDNLTSAYGLMLLYQGIANLLGPPVAGLLCDTYGSYDYSFYASGAFVILSGLILVPTPYLQCWYQNQQKKHTQKKQQQNQEPSTSKPNHKVMSQMETVV